MIYLILAIAKLNFISVFWWFSFALGATLAVLLVFFGLKIYISFLVDRRVSAHQRNFIMQHYGEVQQIYKQMRGWRHDYHNHVQTMKALLALGQTEEHQEYLNGLDADLKRIDILFKTGNVMVDAILNSKISLANSKGININAKAAVPKDMKISEVDLCVIIGNLLDNAMEGCMKCPEDNRFIRVFIGQHKSMLYISVSNSTEKIKRDAMSFLSTKGLSHGFGLTRIDGITAKNGGFVNRQYEEGIFATEISLPLPGKL